MPTLAKSLDVEFVPGADAPVGAGATETVPALVGADAVVANTTPLLVIGTFCRSI
jgi:hypothetical protein